MLDVALIAGTGLVTGLIGDTVKNAISNVGGSLLTSSLKRFSPAIATLTIGPRVQIPINHDLIRAVRKSWLQSLLKIVVSLNIDGIDDGGRLTSQIDVLVRRLGKELIQTENRKKAVTWAGLSASEVQFLYESAMREGSNLSVASSESLHFEPASLLALKELTDFLGVDHTSLVHARIRDAVRFGAHTSLGNLALTDLLGQANIDPDGIPLKELMDNNGSKALRLVVNSLHERPKSRLAQRAAQCWVEANPGAPEASVLLLALAAIPSATAYCSSTLPIVFWRIADPIEKRRLMWGLLQNKRFVKGASVSLARVIAASFEQDDLSIFSMKFIEIAPPLSGGVSQLIISICERTSDHVDIPILLHEALASQPDNVRLQAVAATWLSGATRQESAIPPIRKSICRHQNIGMDRKR
ncbi:hypothetical protein [Bradyrhizobium sp. LB11.1]|uniref:hypothetical protein n=1 Tax=Bradyrhizobium sp. LB11.1 TaxID=3156326 RepID=UPI00339865EF